MNISHKLEVDRYNEMNIMMAGINQNYQNQLFLVTFAQSVNTVNVCEYCQGSHKKSKKCGKSPKGVENQYRLF